MPPERPSPAPRREFAFSLAAEELAQWAEAAVADAEGRLEHLLASDEPPTVEGFLGPLDRILLEVRNVDTLASLMFHAHPDETVRDAGREASERAGRFFSAFQLNARAFRRMQSLPLEREDAPTRFAASRMALEMHRAGVEQSEEGRERLHRLSGEIDRLSYDFYENIAKWKGSITVRGAEELPGLPEAYRKAHPPRPDGTIEIGAESPHSAPVMEYCEDPEVRRRMRRVLWNRGFPENAAVLAQLLAKRHEFALQLGYPNFAAFAIENRMMRTPAAVGAFLDRVYPILRSAADADLRRLLERKRRDDPSATRVENWDETFYTRKLRAEEFGVDAKRLRDYLPYGAVRDGLFRLCGELFGLAFRRMDAAPVWHPTVEAFEVFRSGRLLGRCYLDTVPREGKLRGGGCLVVRQGVEGVQSPEGALVMDLVDPGDSGEAARLDHEKVVGFFHEFGHLVHHLLAGHGRWLYNNAFEGLELDFVEAPSTLFEEWARDPATLQTFARDPVTQAPVPTELVEQVRAAEAFGRATLWLYQLALARAALEIYSRDPATVEPGAVLRECFRRYFTFPLDEGTHLEAAWRHLVGYTAGYYAYVWSGVIAWDILRPFLEKGKLTDPLLAERYAREILTPGASRPAEESIRAYLGRDLSYEGFAEWIGRTEDADRSESR